MPRLFETEHRHRISRHRRVYAACEIAFTAVDGTAAITFLVGSVLVLFPPDGAGNMVPHPRLGLLCPDTRDPARAWLRLAAMGDGEDLAARLQG